MTRAPAMQAGLAARKLSFLDVFRARIAPVWFVLAGSGVTAYHRGEENLKLAA